MNILFEEDGTFKAATLLADNNTSLQVELPTGKRSKIKAIQVLLRFESPRPGELLPLAEAEAAGIDPAFLWENCPEGETGFLDLAKEYAGHPPSPVEATAILLCLQSSPIHFHRKGRGNFRKAPPEILQAALAGQEKKRQQQLLIDRMASELTAGTLPAEFQAQIRPLLHKPDRNRPEIKALEQACQDTGLSPARLMMKCGAFSSTHDYLLDRFLYEYFPEGHHASDILAPTMPQDLPLAAVTAFSIDDASTTEIDDAFSITPLPGGGWRIGIHIAAPALGIRHDDPLGSLARNRLSTVYMPGRKITMLPDIAVEHFTLAAGRDAPALSAYLDIDSEFRLQHRETRIERVNIAANLRHHDLEPWFNEITLTEGLPDRPYASELRLLWEYANILEAARGKAGQIQNQNDYNFTVDWTNNPHASEPGRIHIEQRRRGSPLDKLVSELMIVANAGWGKELAEAGVAALYRAQTSGKVRMTTVAAPHEGLGVDCYTWLTSPLRRYVDLLNQWQLIALLRDEPPNFTARSADFLAALRDFELTYAAYADFQRNMERYWCLRWIQQEEKTDLTAQVIRENLVRIDNLPLVLRLSDLPETPEGNRIRLEITQIDLLDIEAKGRYIENLSAPAEENAG